MKNSKFNNLDNQSKNSFKRLTADFKKQSGLKLKTISYYLESKKYHIEGFGDLYFKVESIDSLLLNELFNTIPLQTNVMKFSGDEDNDSFYFFTELPSKVFENDEFVRFINSVVVIANPKLDFYSPKVLKTWDNYFFGRDLVIVVSLNGWQNPDKQAGMSMLVLPCSLFDLEMSGTLSDQTDLNQSSFESILERNLKKTFVSRKSYSTKENIKRPRSIQIKKPRKKPS
jgi:hypothetical protein